LRYKSRNQKFKNGFTHIFLTISNDSLVKNEFNKSNEHTEQSKQPKQYRLIPLYNNSSRFFCLDTEYTGYRVTIVLISPIFDESDLISPIVHNSNKFFNRLDTHLDTGYRVAFVLKSFIYYENDFILLIVLNSNYANLIVVILVMDVHSDVLNLEYCWNAAHNLKCVNTNWITFSIFNIISIISNISTNRSNKLVTTQLSIFKPDFWGLLVNCIFVNTKKVIKSNLNLESTYKTKEINKKILFKI